MSDGEDGDYNVRETIITDDQTLNAMKIDLRLYDVQDCGEQARSKNNEHLVALRLCIVGIEISLPHELFVCCNLAG